MHKLLGSRAQVAAQLAEKGDFAILPRRKAGQSTQGGERAQPISISKAVLEKYFHMSLNQASKELVSPNSPVFLYVYHHFLNYH